MKSLIVLLPLMILVSCNPSTKESSISSSQATGGTGGGGNSNPPPTMEPRLTKVMSYNQYNMTLSKLTGINSSRASTLFEEIKGSLPADTNIDAMTSFNLVSKTRLADFYCGLYVNDYLAKTSFTNATSMKNHLLSTFLDYDVVSPNPIFDSLVTEVDNVLANNDGQNGKLIPSMSLSANDMNKNLSIMACVTILASTHITMIE
jgi:hypothetical protein